MELNIELYNQQLNNEMRKADMSTKGVLLRDYRRDLTIEDEKKFNKIKALAEKKTLALQDKFPTMLGIDTQKIHAESIQIILAKL